MPAFATLLMNGFTAESLELNETAPARLPLLCYFSAIMACFLLYSNNMVSISAAQTSSLLLSLLLSSIGRPEILLAMGIVNMD